MWLSTALQIRPYSNAHCPLQILASRELGSYTTWPDRACQARTSSVVLICGSTTLPSGTFQRSRRITLDIPRTISMLTRYRTLRYLSRKGLHRYKQALVPHGAFLNPQRYPCITISLSGRPHRSVQSALNSRGCENYTYIPIRKGPF